jgi:WD40 repeat protein
VGDPLVVPAWYDPAARRFRLSWSDTRPGRLTVDADRFLFAGESGVVFDVPRAGTSVRWGRHRFDLVTPGHTYRIHLRRPGAGARRPERVAQQEAEAALRAVLGGGSASGLRPVLDVPTDEFHCAGLAFSHDGTLLAAGTSHGMVVLWDVAAGTPSRQFMHDLCGGPVPAVAFSADDLYLATAGHDGQLKVREVRTGRVLLKRPHPGPLSAVCFDPSGDLLATACSDGAVRVWSRRGEIRNQIDGVCTAGTARLSFAPDGTIAVGGKGRVEAFSADGRLRATATKERLRVWTR